MADNRVEQVAQLLYNQAYEASFGGKSRGRFQVSRDDIKRLLGVSRLHPSKIQQLSDACLATNLVFIDMDGTYAFAETKFVDKWRKLPSRLVLEYASELGTAKPDEEEVDPDEFGEEED